MWYVLPSKSNCFQRWAHSTLSAGPPWLLRSQDEWRMRSALWTAEYATERFAPASSERSPAPPQNGKGP